MHARKVAEACASSGFHKGLNPTVTLWSQFIVFTLLIFGTVWTDVAGGLFVALSAVLIWLLFEVAYIFDYYFLQEGIRELRIA